MSQVLHASNFLRPNILELKLDAFDREEEAIERVVLFMDVRTEHQVDRPVALVNQ